MELFPSHEEEVLVGVLRNLQGDLTAAIDFLLHANASEPPASQEEGRNVAVDVLGQAHGLSTQHNEAPAPSTATSLPSPPQPVDVTISVPGDELAATPALPPQQVTTLWELSLATVAASVVLPLAKHSGGSGHQAGAAATELQARRLLSDMPRQLLVRVWAAVFDAVVDEARAGASTVLFTVMPHTAFAHAFTWFFPFCASDPVLVTELVGSIAKYPYRDKFSDSIMELMFEPLKRCPLITDLAITGCTSLIYPQLCSPHLIKLSLCDCERLNDLAVQWLLERSPQLQELDLGGCNRLTSPRIESGSLVWVNMTTCRGLMFPEVRNSPRLLHVLVPEGCRLDWRRPTAPPAAAGGQDMDGSLLSIDRILACAGDYYAVLGLPADATLPQITKQYRLMALKLHPDKNAHPASVEAFKAMAEAFACLSDVGQRAQYDAHGGAEIRPEVLRRAEQVLAEVQAYVYAHVLKTLFGALPS